ncbi:alpha/beta hydrolase [Aurantiacibacter xanthus]|uniref:Alpha/beta hydrolase n=1 Tax=Aurantiacibacter xanthus TaxID=1784712 RepID=A0A3A1P6W3_9SPHN|nr:alpha/beta hydrolase [Aurantiacibacter xanthus]RIV83217.1 alpha/beta hydrolase [Aurantiacibacter xanthus]
MWHAADGHPIRRIDWPAPPAGVKPRGHLLFMAGRGDAYEKYLESFEHWRLAGWQVSAADWRGQGGSGRLGLGDAGHIDDFGIWVSDLAALWADWAEGRAGPLVLAGHSMGGHLVLRAAVEGVLKPRPAAVVLSAPMLDIFPEHLPLFAKRLVADAMVRLGDPRRAAWKMSEKPGSRPSARQSLLTHDKARYEDEHFWREARPELKLGPGSWGWLAAATRSTGKLFAPGALESLDVPVMIVAAATDKLVSPAAIRVAARRLPDAQLLEFGPEAHHEILREVDPVRNRALAAIDDFLARRTTNKE